MNTDQPAITMVLRTQIVAGPNPRTHFNEERMKELRASMDARGFDPAFPLIVRPIEYQWEPLAKCLNGMHMQWRGKGSVTWSNVKTDYKLPKEKSWSYLLTEDDCDRAVKYLPKFQIAAGERRFKTAVEKAIEYVPCVVRDMSDQELLEIALIENLQREDLTVIEEANGYRRLLDMKDASGDSVHNYASIASRIGRTAQHIMYRVSLCRLADTKAGAALERGEINPAQGRLLARLPTPALRDELLAKTLKGYGGAPWTYEELEKKIKLDYMIELRGAKFDKADATLVPEELDEAGNERRKGGACTDCPWNTMNAEGEKSSRNHLCMNPECYRLKLSADYEKWRLSVTDEAAMRTALPAAENIALWNESGTALSYKSPYVELSVAPESDELRAKVSNPVSWKKLIHGQGVPVVLARDDDGKVHELALHSLVVEAARLNEKDKPAEDRTLKPLTSEKSIAAQVTTTSESGSFEHAVQDLKTEEDKAAAADEHERARRIEAAQYKAVLEAAKVPKIPDGFWPLAIAALLDSVIEHGDAAEMSLRYGCVGDDETSDELLRRIAKHVETPVSFATDLLLMMHMPKVRSGELPKWAKIFGLNLKAVTKQVELDMALERRIKDEAVIENAVFSFDESSGQEVEDFEWNSNQVAENPHVFSILFPKSAKLSASVELARTARGWHFGVDVNGKNYGHSSPCAGDSTSYGNRALAMRSGFLEIEQTLKSNGADEGSLKKVRQCIDALGEDKDAREKKSAAKPAKTKSGLSPEGHAKIVDALKKKKAKA